MGKDSIQAAAALVPVSRAKYVAFLCLAMFVQINWGLYGVCSRFLQTQATQPIPTIQLSVILTAVAWAGCIVFYTIPSACITLAAAARGHRMQQKAIKEVQQLQIHSSHQGGTNIVIDKPAAPTAAGTVRGDGITASASSTTVVTESSTSSSKHSKLRQKLQAWAVAAVIGGLVAAQALTLVYASRFTLAYLVQLVFMLTPLATALANKVLLKQPTPHMLWPTVLVTLAGSVLFVVGAYIEASHLRSVHSSRQSIHDVREMAVGLSLAVVSMLLLTAYLVSLQVTQNIVTGVQVMWGNTYVALVVFIPLACIVEGTDWSWVLVLRPLDWAVIVFAGFFIDACNTIFTQHCSRVLGAAVVSMFICLRLVSSLVGSIVFMHEVPTTHTFGGALEWLGFGIVLVTMTAYMVLQHFNKQDKEEAELPQCIVASSLVSHDPVWDYEHYGSLCLGLSHSLQPGAASAIELQRQLLRQLQHGSVSTMK